VYEAGGNAEPTQCRKLSPMSARTQRVFALIGFAGVATGLVVFALFGDSRTGPWGQLALASGASGMALLIFAFLGRN
jgi:hypothetical protein